MFWRRNGKILKNSGGLVVNSEDCCCDPVYGCECINIDGCGYDCILSGLTGDCENHNGSIADITLATFSGGESCLWANIIGGDIPLEFNMTCVDGVWILNINDGVLEPEEITSATVAMGNNVLGYPPEGSYSVTFVGGVCDGQTATATIVIVECPDPRCEEVGVTCE